MTIGGMLMKYSTVLGNQASAGGGLYAIGDVTIQNSTIALNTAAGSPAEYSRALAPPPL